MALSTITAKTKITASTLNTVINAVNAIQTATPNAYITERWSSGTSWYRKWSDGWIEQGGRLSGTPARFFSNKTLTFNKSFTTTNYTLCGITELIDSANVGASVTATLVYNKRSTTQLIIGSGSYDNGNFIQAISWYACRILRL